MVPFSKEIPILFAFGAQDFLKKLGGSVNLVDSLD